MRLIEMRIFITSVERTAADIPTLFYMFYSFTSSALFQVLHAYNIWNLHLYTHVSIKFTSIILTI